MSESTRYMVKCPKCDGCGYRGPDGCGHCGGTGKMEVVAASDLALMEMRKDGAYIERNLVVAALAKCFPSGVARTAIEGWSEDWHQCVYVDLPTGQASWHFHDSQAPLFNGLPPYMKPWDGHDTPEKYRRLAALTAQSEQQERPALVCALRGLLASLSRDPTEQELRAAAHEFTVRADRLSAKLARREDVDG